MGLAIPNFLQFNWTSMRSHHLKKQRWGTRRETEIVGGRWIYTRGGCTASILDLAPNSKRCKGSRGLYWKKKTCWVTSPCKDGCVVCFSWGNREMVLVAASTWRARVSWFDYATFLVPVEECGLTQSPKFLLSLRYWDNISRTSSSFN